MPLEPTSNAEISIDHIGVTQYARMWPRQIFDCIAKDPKTGRKRIVARNLEILKQPGVYILYRDDIPYYIGQAQKLRYRLWRHATVPGTRYYNFWNFFSVFVVESPKYRNEIEGLLIAAMPTANSAKPRLPRQKLPPTIRAMMRKLRRNSFNVILERS